MPLDKDELIMLGEIKNAVSGIPELHEKVNRIDRKVAGLEIKAAIIGAISGFAAVLAKGWFSIHK